MNLRIYEMIVGSVRLRVIGDLEQSVLAGLVQRGVSMRHVRSFASGDYECTLALRDVRLAVQFAKVQRVKIRFARKSGLPFWLWRARRRKAFVAGAVLFVAGLYALSSFVWRIQIDGTDQPEAVQAALNKLNIHPGSWLYRVLDQDSIQLALLDQLPNISWVGVRVQGTVVYVRIIPKVLPANRDRLGPQDIVAGVPGVIARILADSGQSVIKPGQYVTPGTLLISGRLEDGRSVTAKGEAFAIVWYRSMVELPTSTQVAVLTGAKVQHDYLRIAGFPIQVWGFSHPSYEQSFVQSTESPVFVFGYRLPILWQQDTVFAADVRKQRWNKEQLVAQATRFAATDSLRRARAGAKLLRQTVLHSKLEHGKLYLTVWTEIWEDIGEARPISAASPPHPS